MFLITTAFNRLMNNDSIRGITTSTTAAAASMMIANYSSFTSRSAIFVRLG